MKFDENVLVPLIDGVIVFKDGLHLHGPQETAVCHGTIVDVECEKGVIHGNITVLCDSAANLS